MISGLSPARKASYAVVVLGFYLAARYGLAVALIACLFAYMLLDQTEAALCGAGVGRVAARWIAVAVFVVLSVLLGLIFISFLRLGLSRLPVLLDRLLPRIADLCGRFGFSPPFESQRDARDVVLDTVRSHATALRDATGFLTQGFFQIIIGLIATVLKFITRDDPALAKMPPESFEADFLRECRERTALFSASFERVMSAQLSIAAINAAISGVFLFSMHIPFRTFLTLAAFFCGLVPIAGNIASNSLIVAAALTHSDRLAVAALIFLIVMHKLQYVISGRVLGARLEIPTWLTLAGMLVGQTLMGGAGIILAPTLVFYLREELRSAART